MKNNTIINQVCTKVFIGIKNFAHIEFLKNHKISFLTHLCLFFFCVIITTEKMKFNELEATDTLLKKVGQVNVF